MTNVILAVIGILLASFSALIMIDYGGTYFVASQAKADAASLRNAGQNVFAAYRLYDQRYGQEPTSVSDLTSNSSGSRYLTSMPNVTTGTPQGAWQQITVGGETHDAFIVSGVTDNACMAANLMSSNFPEPMILPTEPRFVEGCYATLGSNSYYRLLDGSQGALPAYSGQGGDLLFD